MKKLIAFLLIIALLCPFAASLFVHAEDNSEITVGNFIIKPLVQGTQGQQSEAQLYYYTGQDTVLDIPEQIGEYTITSIYNGVFRKKITPKLQVEKIIIPKTVVDVGESSKAPLSWCYDCTTIEVDKQNPVYASNNGILYSKDMTTLVRVPCAYPGSCLVIRSGVKTIGNGALSNCLFTEIEFPGTLESIGSRFMEKSKVEELYFPDSLVSINRDAFWGDEQVKYIYFGKNTIMNTGFVFSVASSVQEYAVSGNNPYLSSQDGLLMNKDKTKLIAYPPAKRTDTFMVPESVLTIAKSAFCFCNIVTIHTNLVESIESGAFDGLSNRFVENQSIIFGESLPSLKIDGGVYSAKNWTFLNKNCAITSVAFSGSKRTVYGYYGSTAYQFFYINETKKPYFDFVLLDEEPELGFRYTELTNDSIRIDSFTGFDTSLEIPEYIDGKKVVQIGANAFAGNTSITELTLPSTLETIDSYAFADLINVETLTIPAGVNSIGSYALSAMSALKKLYINSFSCIIGEGALPAAKIFACTGSTAESYAANHDLSFYSIGHQFVSEEIENNKIRKTCTLCGYTELTDNPNIHHEYEAVVTEPTCTLQGYTTYTCSICGDSYITDYKAALGHEIFEIKATSPTCTAEGKTAGSKCARCNLILKEQETIAKLPHEYDGGITTTAPTCVRKGVKTYTCRNCDAFYTEELDIIAHQYVEIVKAPTCTEKGYTSYICSYCNDSYTAEETAMLPHTVQEIAAVAATCTKEGNTAGSRCAVCGLILEAPQTTEKVPHQYDDGTLTLAPTCQKEGIRIYRCRSCDAVYSAAVEKIAHDYLAFVKVPTCTETGYTTYTCAYCAHSYVAEETAMLPHTVQEIAAVAATCTKEGSTAGSRCAVCGLILEATQTTEKVPHQYDEGTITTSPTCRREGVKTYRCRDCTVFYEKKLAKVDHHYATVVKSAASFSKNGVINEQCSMCTALRKSTVVKSLKTAKLSANVLNFTGKKLAAPKVLVKDSAGKTVSAKYYTASYISRATGKAVGSISAIGQYKVQLVFKGAYTGTSYLYFTVKPRTLALQKPVSAKKTVTAKWKQDASVTGYQLIIATNKSFTAGKKVFNLNKNTLLSKKITGLKSGKVYYLKIRSYKKITVDGKKLNIYSDYSPVKSVKCK